MHSALSRVPAELWVFVVATGVYALAAAPGVGWMDSGELTHAAYTLGGAHPPGHPLHSLLGKLATLVPVGEVAYRVSLLSGVAMAAALAGVVALARRLSPEPRIGMVAGVVGATLAGLAPAAMVNATRAEVYAPTAALLMWATVAVVEMAMRVRAESDKRTGSLALLAAFACALAAAFHPLIAAAASLPLAVAMIVLLGRRMLRLAPWCVLLGAVALLAYAYMPVRAMAPDRPPLVWDDPQSWDNFVTLVTGAGYQSNFALGGMAERFVGLWGLVGEFTALGVLLGGLVGLGFASATGLGRARIVLAIPFVMVLGAATQSALNPDLRGYILFAILALAAGLAPLTVAALRLLPESVMTGRYARPVAAAAVLGPLCLIGPVSGGWVELDRGDDPQALWHHTASRMPAGPGIYFASGDHSLFAGQYEQFVAGARPDIALVHEELCRDEWFLRHVDRRLPELHVPYIDDGVRGQLAERLAVTGLRQGRPVGGDEPAIGRLEVERARPMDRAYQWSLELVGAGPGDEPRPPLDFEGTIGRKIAMVTALARAGYEAGRGRFANAARAAGLDRHFDATTLEALAAARPSSDRPPLLTILPHKTRYLLHESWITDLFADDLLWQAGQLVAAPPPDAPYERKLHAQLRRLLLGDIEPGSAELFALGKDAAVASTRVLAMLGSAEAVDKHVSALIERWPRESGQLALLASVRAGRGDFESSAELFERSLAIDATVPQTHARYAMVLLRLGNAEEAERAWQRARALDPSMPESIPEGTLP